jgi:hypothetical protein
MDGRCNGENVRLGFASRTGPTPFDHHAAVYNSNGYKAIMSRPRKSPPRLTISHRFQP